MAEELKVVLKKSENLSYGFSLLGTAGLPHVIYDIMENSPAAECGEVEAGDVIVRVNGTDVHRLTTKEVLKCLRLSQDPVTLELKRDPIIKARVRHFLTHQTQHNNLNYSDIKDSDLNVSPAPSPTPTHSTKLLQQQRSEPTCRKSRIPTIIKSPAHVSSKSCPQSPHGQQKPKLSQIPTANGTINFTHQNNYHHQQQQQQQQFQQHNHHSTSLSNSSSTSSTSSSTNSAGVVAEPNQKKQRFEAYMMTGDLILNLSRTPQSSGLITSHAKKVDSLRDSPRRSSYRRNGAVAPQAKCESSLSSPSFSDSSDSIKSVKRSITKEGNSDLNNRLLNNQDNSDYPQHQHQQQQQLINDDNNSEYVINKTNEFEKNNSSNSGGCFGDSDGGGGGGSGELNTTAVTTTTTTTTTTKDNSGCVVSASSNSIVKEQQQQYNNTFGDSVDYGKFKIKTQYKQDNKFVSSTTASSTTTNFSGSGSGGGGGSGGSGSCVGGGGGVGNSEQQQHLINKQHFNTSTASSSSSTTAQSDNLNSSPDICFSVPTSPTALTTPIIEALTALKQKESANSVPTSPESGGGVGGGGGQEIVLRRNHQLQQNGIVNRRNDSAGFRTSRSEDHLQHTQRDILGATVPIDIDEDVNSSLNTLLDTRQDSEDSQSSCDRDRIVWTYNAPVLPTTTTTTTPHSSNSHSHSSSISSSPHRSNSPLSPQSPTSVSSSIMSSNSCGSNKGGGGGGGGSGGAGGGATTSSMYSNIVGNSNGEGYGNGSTLQSLVCPVTNGDHSVSEAVSNISSPDYQDDDNLLSSKDMAAMAISDPSDSDSTIMVSDAVSNHRNHHHHQNQHHNHHHQQQQHNHHHQPHNNSSSSNNTTNNNNNNNNNSNNQNSNHHHQYNNNTKHDRNSGGGDHKIVIKVKGYENSLSSSAGSIGSSGAGGGGAYSEFKDSEDELATITEDVATVQFNSEPRESSPPMSDDGSDVDSLHSYHYSPKAVDIPSAVRLAKRLYGLDGFKKSDVSRHLSKNNDFSRAVADEYLKYFEFEKLTLDEALRLFLQQFSLSGETQERERVLVHFSRRYLDCNPGTYNSQDAVHTLTCAIMLLNTDLHGQNIGRKMTCAEFIDNLAELNDGENFPKDVLKSLYQAIKSHPLEWALDDDSPDLKPKVEAINQSVNSIGLNPFLDIPQNATAIEYKKGYVMRKCCFDSNYKKTPFGKRSWKMFYCTLRDLVLYLHKDEHGFRKNQMSDNVHNAIRIHHALATKAADYTKKQHVFRLHTADQSEYLFQTSDSKELQSWIDTINFVCASFSAPPLEGAVGSQKRFQRPLLPSSHTKLLMREQLANHDDRVGQLEDMLNEHKRGPIPNKGLPLQNYKEKESYLQYELKRYKTYVYILSSRLVTDQQSDFQNCIIVSSQQQPQQLQHHDEAIAQDLLYQPLTVNLSGGGGAKSHNSIMLPPIQQHQPTFNVNQSQPQPQQQQQQLQQSQPPINRYSYRAAIYRTDQQPDLG